MTVSLTSALSPRERGIWSALRAAFTVTDLEKRHQDERQARVNLRGRLFPLRSHHLPGERWITITLRSLHLLGVAGTGAGFLVSGSEPHAWRPYLILTVGTGLGMTLLYIWADGRWLLQICRQSVLVKLVLLGLIPVWPTAGPGLFAAVILLSGLTSHAPARVRHYSVLRRHPPCRRPDNERPGKE
jgi:hypothetical protein